ncbi:MAG: glycosyltransferase [Gemmatimonadetes bacterium]|nr:glycosyltransferase [Gemmatimonadota bacterium]
MVNSRSCSVVVSVFNSEAGLNELIRRLEPVLSNLTDQHELILVNDGSADRSWDVIQRLAREHPWVRGIDLMRNYGQHNALLAGINSARFDTIVTMDDDLQHPPEEIPRLLDTLNEGYDVVYGRPRKRSHSLWRNLASRLIKSVLKVTLGAEMGSHSSAFRAFRAPLRRGFTSFAGAQLSIDVLLSWSSKRVTHVLVEHDPRRIGTSGYSLSRLMVLALELLTGYSALPLRIASLMGLSTSVVGLVMFAYVVVRRFTQTNYTPGFAFLAAEIAFFAGMQMFAIGVIGEYIAKLHFRTMGKPPYVVQEETGAHVLPE